MFKWISENKNWFFSGIGGHIFRGIIAVIAIIISFYIYSQKTNEKIIINSEINPLENSGVINGTTPIKPSPNSLNNAGSIFTEVINTGAGNAIKAENYIVYEESNIRALLEMTEKDVTDQFIIEKLELIIPNKNQIYNSRYKNMIDVDEKIRKTEDHLKEKLRAAYKDYSEEEIQEMADRLFHRRDELRERLEAAKEVSNAMVDVLYDGVPNQMGITMPWDKNKIPKVLYKVKYKGKERLKDLIITFGLYDKDDVRVGSFMYFLSSLRPNSSLAETIDVRNVSDNGTPIEFNKVRIENFRIP